MRLTRGAPAVVPGPEPAPLDDCAACGYGRHHGVLRTRAVVEGIEMILCLDFASCMDRVRGQVAGVTL